MSKIQKAIRRIEESHNVSQEKSSNLPLGKVISDPARNVESMQEANSPGDDTRQMAALGSEKPVRSIIVDREALRTAGFLAAEGEEGLLVDQYRNIKRPLIAHAYGRRATQIPDGHLVLVSSALSGDGKTFNCINLALSIAREQDKSVLLVDADLAKGHITRLFGAQDEPGLLDLLETDAKLNLDDTILSTDIKGLSIMAAGRMRHHSTELLASDRMERLVRALTAQDPNRMVVFDSSPLLMTSEARVLASVVGQVVMVVCAEQTPQQAVVEAIATIDESKAVNLVLNQVRGGKQYEYGGYGYGYGAGRGEND